MDVLKVTGLHSQKPAQLVDVNTEYTFKIAGAKHQAPVTFKDGKGRFGPPGEEITSQAGVIKFRLIALDEEGGKPIPGKEPVWQSLYLADEDYMDEGQYEDANRQLKAVLVKADVAIGGDDAFVVSDLNDREVTLKTRGYVDGQGVERVDVSWPKFME